MALVALVVALVYLVRSVVYWARSVVRGLFILFAAISLIISGWLGWQTPCGASTVRLLSTFWSSSPSSVANRSGTKKRYFKLLLSQ